MTFVVKPTALRNQAVRIAGKPTLTRGYGC
jgi:hypothetical protein